MDRLVSAAPIVVFPDAGYMKGVVNKVVKRGIPKAVAVRPAEVVPLPNELVNVAEVAIPGVNIPHHFWNIIATLKTRVSMSEIRNVIHHLHVSDDFINGYLAAHLLVQEKIFMQLVQYDEETQNAIISSVIFGGLDVFREVYEKPEIIVEKLRQPGFAVNYHRDVFLHLLG